MNIKKSCKVATSEGTNIAAMRRAIYKAHVYADLPSWFIVRAYCGTEDCINPTHLQGRKPKTPRYQPGELYDLHNIKPSLNHRDNSRDDYTGEVLDNV